MFLEKSSPKPVTLWCIVAKQDTYLKTSCKPSSELAAEEKVFVKTGSTWGWEQIVMLRGEQHSKVELLQKPGATWYIFNQHWDIIRES